MLDAEGPGQLIGFVYGVRLIDNTDRWSHGGADNITSVNHSRRLYDAYRGPREIWIVQGAPHTGAYFADRPLYVERVAGFFARHLGLDVSSHLRLVEEEEVS